MGLLVLILGLAVFLASHVFVTFRAARAALIARFGHGYRAAFALMALVGLWAGWVALRGRRFAEHPALLRTLAIVTPFGFIATEAGWTVTEVGRQPWVVQGILRTSDAVSPMPGLVVPMIVFGLLYLGLAAIVVTTIAGLVRETR